MRHDAYLSNDSGGMSLLSSSIVDRAIADGCRSHESFSAAHEAVLVALEGDDSFIVRVVADEPLTDEEEAQWICRIRTRLRIPCGRLLICGGFDPRSLADYRENGPGESVLEVRVPPGEYRVDVYTHLTTMTGRILRDRWDEKIGAWFRREHKRKAFPSWLAAELTRSSDEDPGHEKEWDRLKASVASKKLRVDTSTLDWVGYVIHLHSLDDAKLSQPDDGWFGTDSEFRRPVPFPMGLPAVGAEDSECRYALQPLLPRKPKSKGVAIPQLPAAPVLEMLPEPVAIDGGAVVVPVERLPDIARIAWFCDREVEVALTVTLPAATKWAPKVKPDTPAIVSVEGDRVKVGFTQTAFLPFGWIADLVRSLRKLPDGSVLDVCFARTDAPEVTSGNHRWRGTVRKDRWSITHAWPATVTHAAVEEALALVDEMDRGKGIHAHDATEADTLVDGVRQDEFLSGVGLVRRGLVLMAEKDAKAYGPYVARYVFRHRLRQAWDLSSDEAEWEELEQLMKGATAALTEALTPVVSAVVAMQATGAFTRGNLRRWKGVNLERLADYDAGFRTVGLEPLGDILFEFASNVAVRAYGGDGMIAYASLMWPRDGEPQVDLFTRFSDGSSVTTTSTPGAKDIEAAKVYRGSFPGEPVDVLWRAHQEAIDRRQKTGCTALTTEATVEAFAKAVEEFFERQRAAMRR